MKYTLKITITLLLAAVISLPSYADTPNGDLSHSLNYNLYHLSASAEDEIDNDIMKVTLLASHQSMQSSEANKVVNQQMSAALKILKKTKDIHYETGSYQTQPIYKNQQISGWKASQQIELKSTNVDQLSDVVGKLQTELKISSMRFDVSKPVRQKAENALSVEALNQFKERALLIQKTMGANSYHVVAIDINTGTQRPPVRRMMRAEMAMASDSSTPSVEAGNSNVTVNVTGQIQLVFN
jgi:predicted secreted protein